MQLPRSGRIVLIDDKPEEARPLLTAFTKHAIPHLYYDGHFDGLPDAPLDGIRVVFLDIELQGMEGQNDKNKASALVARLQKLISVSNGPYVIIFWTRHFDVIKLVLENCTVASISPVAWVDLEKSQCLVGGQYDINTLAARLKEKLETIGAFRLYVEWENVLHMASSEFIREFSRLIPPGDRWSTQTSYMFYKLYKAYVDKNEIADKTEQFKCACWLMNRSFHDTLQEYTSLNLKLPDKFTFAGGDVDATTLAKLNSHLFLNSSTLTRPQTGYVYRENNDNIKACLNASLFKLGQAPPQAELCKIIITPECDLAQNKVLKYKHDNKDNKVHRIVYGLLLPVSADLNSKRKDIDAKFDIGPLWHEEKSWIIILHFSTISFQHEGELQDDHLFYLRRDLVFDILSKTANHVNRLGNFQIG